MVESSRTGPVGEAERIQMLDLLRGIAVLGILVTNIQHFAMPAGAVRNPTIYGDLTGANFWAHALTFTLAYQKFLPVFSMLFGAGIVLSAGRREAAGYDPGGWHYRRMAVLLLIGLIHSYLVWYGDILVAYALCGCVVFLFRRRSPTLLIALGIGTLAVSPLFRSLFVAISNLVFAGGGQGGSSIEQIIANDVAAFQGGWLDNLRTRVVYTFEAQTVGFLIMIFWRASGLMLIGMGLFKLGVLSGKRSPGMYVTLIAIALLFGLPVTAGTLYLNAVLDWESGLARLLAEQVIYWVGIVISLGYIGVVGLACRGGCRFLLGRPLQAVGRMALTNYLVQSLVCTFVFYGFGLGLYGSVPRVGQLGVVVGVWLLMLVLSPLWLRYFRFGPAEWLWRSLSYGRWPVWRR
jgi:uncharacterized protein